MPHSVIRSGADGRWTVPDRLLAVALTRYEASMCPCGCGYPRGKAWDADNDGWFEARTVQCFAKAAADRWKEEHAATAEPGTLPYVIDSRDEPAASTSAADRPHDQEHQPDRDE